MLPALSTKIVAPTVEFAPGGVSSIAVANLRPKKTWKSCALPVTQASLIPVLVPDGRLRRFNEAP
jgi:hypothetical protein